MEGWDHLDVALKSCRELIQHAVTFTRYDTSTEVVEWSHCLTRRVRYYLVLQSATKRIPSWFESLRVRCYVLH